MQQDLFTIPADTATKKPKGLSRRRHSLLSDFEARLADNAADHDLSAAMVHYARELVSLENALSDDEQRALLLLVLASMVEGRNGSTRMPLETRENGHLAELVSALLPARGAENMAPGTVLSTLENVLEQGIASTIIGGPDDYRPLIVDNGHLYHQRMLHYEDRLVDAVRRRLALPDSTFELDQVRSALDATLADMPMVGDSPMQLNAEQQYALLSAVYRPLTVISGGPGTGKTSIVVSLLRMLNHLGVAPDEIALAAPTGKAANRLGESIQAQLSALASAPDASVPDQLGLDGLDDPRTLHRLLGYSQARGGFYYHENNRLRQKVIVVDEASMIDLFLMERLISAVDPSARLILLGDAEQLPSVDSGAVFRDLVPDQVDTRTPWRELVEPAPQEVASDEPTAAYAVRLQTSYRMDPTSPAGSNILLAAQSLNRGEVEPLFRENPTGDDPLIHIRDGFDAASSPNAVTKQGVEMLEPAEDAPAPDPVLMNGFVDWWYEQLVASLDGFGRRIEQTFEFDGARFSADAHAELDELFDHFARFRVLAITRVFATGSERLNAAFHARHLRHLGRTNAADLEVGEPVIMLQNDYGRGLFNGDQGLILDVQRTDGDTRRIQRMAVFERDGEFVPFSLGALRRHIEHAFALTVHKAQGSEFDTVAIVLPTEDIPLLTREILYTGMTRSKRSVVFVGQPGRVEAAAKNPVRRFSGVGEKLAE